MGASCGLQRGSSKIQSESASRPVFAANGAPETSRPGDGGEFAFAFAIPIPIPSAPPDKSVLEESKDDHDSPSATASTACSNGPNPLSQAESTDAASSLAETLSTRVFGAALGEKDRAAGDEPLRISFSTRQTRDPVRTVPSRTTSMASFEAEMHLKSCSSKVPDRKQPEVPPRTASLSSFDADTYKNGSSKASDRRPEVPSRTTSLSSFGSDTYRKNYVSKSSDRRQEVPSRTTSVSSFGSETYKSDRTRSRRVSRGSNSIF
jgi:hypothetical protein